jgi:hypothetical protein
VRVGTGVQPDWQPACLTDSHTPTYTTHTHKHTHTHTHTHTRQEEPSEKLTETDNYVRGAIFFTGVMHLPTLSTCVMGVRVCVCVTEGEGERRELAHGRSCTRHLEHLGNAQDIWATGNRCPARHRRQALILLPHLDPSAS